MRMKERHEKREESNCRFWFATYDKEGILNSDFVPRDPCKANSILMTFGDEDSRDAAIRCLPSDFLEPDNVLFREIISNEKDIGRIIAQARQLYGHWPEIICGENPRLRIVGVDISIDEGIIALSYAYEGLNDFAFYVPIFIGYEVGDMADHVILDFKLPALQSGYEPTLRFIREGNSSTVVDKVRPDLWRKTKIEHNYDSEVHVTEYTDF